MKSFVYRFSWPTDGYGERLRSVASMTMSKIGLARVSEAIADR